MPIPSDHISCDICGRAVPTDQIHTNTEDETICADCAGEDEADPDHCPRCGGGTGDPSCGKTIHEEIERRAEGRAHIDAQATE